MTDQGPTEMGQGFPKSLFYCSYNVIFMQFYVNEFRSVIGNNADSDLKPFMRQEAPL